MNVKVYYKVPAPPVEGENGVMMPTRDMIVTRRYENVKMSYEKGVLVLFNAFETVAVYTEFECVEPVE